MEEDKFTLMEIKYSSHSIWLWQTQMLIMPDCNLLTINIWENVSKLFDHAAQNSSNYLNGHCFVSIMLCVPVWNQDKISYLSVPLGYRMWKKKESKLELAGTMIRKVMPEFQSREHVIILCDSWYTKQNLVFLQLYGAELQRDWNADQSDQYQLLCHETFAVSG